jgi:hypothetical protein
MDRETTSSSDRLNYMLKGSTFSMKHGQIEVISKHTGYTRTAVKRWLESNALPRCPQQRIEVAQKLSVDLIYWEYGINYTYLKETTVNDASIYRAIFKVVDEKKCDNSISEEDMLKIKEIIQCASNQNFFKDLVSLVEYLIELKINKTK